MRKVTALAITIMIAIGIVPKAALAERNDQPQILRVEQSGKELSQDINNPTKLPYFHTLKFIGNDACKNNDISVKIYLDGNWTGVGLVAEFDEDAEYYNSNGRYTHSILLDHIHAIKYVIFDEGQHNIILTESPTYYVVYLDEYSSELRLVNGEDIALRLTADQLIIETKQVYPHMNRWPILLKDRATGEEQYLDFYDDQNFLMQANTLIFSNLSINREHIYEVTISRGTFTNGKYVQLTDLSNIETYSKLDVRR